MLVPLSFIRRQEKSSSNHLGKPDARAAYLHIPKAFRSKRGSMYHVWPGTRKPGRLSPNQHKTPWAARAGLPGVDQAPVRSSMGELRKCSAAQPCETVPEANSHSSVVLELKGHMADD